MIYLFLLIGYLHEQSRKDRDEYVTINFNNIRANKSHNFDKCESCDLQNSTYDFDSVMHYGSTAFGIRILDENGDWTGQLMTTIEAKNGQSIGQRNGFSSLDIKGINDFYCGKYLSLLIVKRVFQGFSKPIHSQTGI